MHYYLYHTLGCHLCELAEKVIEDVNQRLHADVTIQYVKQDIATDELLMERFAVRIPVLEAQDSGHCLDWPFDHQALVDFINDAQ